MKHYIYSFLLLLFTILNLNGQEQKLNIVVIGAHPDDCDIRAGGTALLFSSLGHRVLFISVTNGDAGHHEMGGGMLAKRRTAEAKEAGKRLGVEYIVLDNHDGELMPALDIRLQLIRHIRNWNADMVFGPRPNDYHPDHRNTAVLIQDCAYMVIVPNIAPDTPPLKKNPYFFYVEDNFQKPDPFKADIAIDISKVFDKKIYAMAAHESQFFEWLPWTADQLNKVPEGENERLKWLAEVRKPRISETVRESLVKWYGSDKANKVTAAEAFEICEYGRRPSEQEIKRIFPMLK